MKIYTKTGDVGETSLFGGQRVWKDDLRVDAYGTVDELNALLGFAVNQLKNDEVKDLAREIQNDLFTIGSDLATPIEKDDTKFPIPRVEEKFIKKLEDKIDQFDGKNPPLKEFILPGGTAGSSLLHYARTVCRRAERKVVALSKDVEIGGKIIVYLNRLSDLLFVLARYENYSTGTSDIKWQK